MSTRLKQIKPKVGDQAKKMITDLSEITKEKQISQLSKAFYCLKQIGRQWFYKLDTRV